MDEISQCNGISKPEPKGDVLAQASNNYEPSYREYSDKEN